MGFCCGWNLWCILDAVTRCHFLWICNRHDAVIRADMDEQ